MTDDDKAYLVSRLRSHDPCATDALLADSFDEFLSTACGLDWESTIGPGETFCRSDRHLVPCWMCGAPGTHVDNLWVRCTNRDCILKDPVPRMAWQQAGADAAMCLTWAKRFWKLAGECHAKRNDGLDQHAHCRQA